MKVIQLTSKGRPPKNIVVAVAVKIQVDPDDNRNCLTGSWKNRSGASGRCRGITTILDTNALECSVFSQTEVTRKSLYIDPSTRLYEPDGEVATWGKSVVIRRCNACIIGEQVIRNWGNF